MLRLSGCNHVFVRALYRAEPSLRVTKMHDVGLGAFVWAAPQTHTFSSHLHIIVRETDACQHDKSAFKPIPQLLNPGPLLLPSFDTCSKHPEMLLCSDTMSSARWTSCIRSGPMCFPCGTFSLLSLQNSKPGCRRPTKIVVSCGWSYQSSYTPPLVLPWRPGGHRPSGPQDQILPAA